MKRYILYPAALILLFACAGCSLRYPIEGAPTRDDGSPVPVPSYTNTPEVYHGK
jgi:predicted small lipoprotein YifL